MPKKILIVDDSQAERLNLERIVTGAGHLALLASNGEEAVQRARAEDPDLILLDVNMPLMDGFAVTRKLKADESTKGIGIVFVTGKDQRADRAWGQMLGAKGYVAKPYTPQQILEQLQA